MTKPALVIVTTHFGYHFSGGSTATCEIFDKVQQHFDSVTVIGTQCGDHPFANFTFLPYRYPWQALALIRQHSTDNTVFYGDFYNSWMLALLKARYCFTYHDNWPEQKTLSIKDRIKSWWIWPLYRYIFSQAQAVFTVSEFKYKAIGHLNPNTQLVRNGFAHQRQPVRDERGDAPEKAGIVMSGNIDPRKYQQAIALFTVLNRSQTFTDKKVSIDIYGRPNDAALARQLDSFPFVTLKGYHNRVPYHRYAVMLHTSVMENLSLSWCEALSAGATVVSFDVGGANEVIDVSLGHHLIKPFDIDPMADALVQTLGSPKPLLNCSQQLVDFDWSLAASIYLDTLLKTLPGSLQHEH